MQPYAIKRSETITFPPFSGVRCLMMPYVQGDPSSVPDVYAAYRPILASLVLKAGDVGFLTIDESIATAGTPHRGARARFGRALHTEVGRDPARRYYCWGGREGGGWGRVHRVTLDGDVRILLANNLGETCAVWNSEHPETSLDGDIGDVAASYPYDAAAFLGAGEVYEIGILTPHESLPVSETVDRQFLRIVSSGVHGREPYFTENPLMERAL